MDGDPSPLRAQPRGAQPSRRRNISSPEPPRPQVVAADVLNLHATVSFLVSIFSRSPMPQLSLGTDTLSRDYLSGLLRRAEESFK